MPVHKYTRSERVDTLYPSAHEWASKRLERAPIWASVDLRDGNQSLPEPMGPSRKRRFLDLLVQLGYKEIEVGYPSASRDDFDFVRNLVRYDWLPEDITVVVFTPAREDLIARTLEAIRGLRNEVVVHLCAATAPVWRNVVLRVSREGLLRTVLRSAEQILRGTEGDEKVRYQYSPEAFNLTEPDFAIEVCDAVTELWQACPSRPVIINLPSTVETSLPSTFADQVEYMHLTMGRRDGVILSVHPHNDRGTAVATAELSLLAGADRVEGCVLGNGERTGNVDLVTLGLNLYTMGIDPMVDLSNVGLIRQVVEECTGIATHARHPYSGDLVYTAFSGTHQDAIKKGLEARDASRAGVSAEEGEQALTWEIPYLPIDPGDVGRGYEAIIRVNSQSGKSGIAYLLRHNYGVALPRELQLDFSHLVQETTDALGREILTEELWRLFQKSYVITEAGGPHTRMPGSWPLFAESKADGASDRSAIEEYLNGLQLPGGHYEVLSIAYQEELNESLHAPNVAFINFRAGTRLSAWAVGIADSREEATRNAVLRIVADGLHQQDQRKHKGNAGELL